MNTFTLPLTCILVTSLIFSKCKSIASEITACVNLSSSSLTGNGLKLVDVLLGSKVSLFCHYCDEQEDYNAKLWFYRPRRNISFREIEFNNNDEVLKMSVTPSHTLHINNFRVKDSGIYVCKNVENSLKKNITYALDGIFNDKINYKRGTMDQWKEYKRTILDPINEKFKKSQQKILINKNSFNYSFFKVITDWDDWGLCKVVNYQKGMRTKVGRCRLHTEIVNSDKCAISNVLPNENMFKQFFIDGHDHSCRSLELNKTLPGISRIIRNIPEFMAVETCFVSQNALIQMDKNSGRTIKLVAEKSHITLVCSEINNTPHEIRWFKNNKFLNSSFRNNLGVNEKEPHLTIDIYNSLHILQVTKDEEGNYTCSVDGKQIHQFEVKVVSKTKTLNQEFIRYSIYLGFVLSLTITCYCAGVCVAWHRKASFVDPFNLNKIKTNSLLYERVKLIK